MHLARILSAVAGCAVAAVACSSLPASADGAKVERRVVKKHVGIAKRHPIVFNAWGYPATSADPYAYSYEPRPWYPYYNSGEWVRRAAMRYRTRYDLALPDYYSSYGYPLKCKGKAAILCENPGDRHW